MRKTLVLLCLVSLPLIALTSSTAMGRGNEPTAEFTNQLNDVREDDAQADLMNLFIRERENQLQITAATEPEAAIRHAQRAAEIAERAPHDLHGLT